MTTRIFIEDSFDSAHFLPNVPPDHKCARLHGHTYRVRIEICGDVDPITGWIMDYSEIKTAWQRVKEQLDHHLLNDLIPNSTSELIAAWILNRLDLNGLCRLELRETANAGTVINL